MIQTVKIGNLMTVKGIIVPAKIFPAMVPIRAGTFKMGSLECKDEQPIREVTISPFYMGMYPVTNTEYLPFALAKGLKISELMADPLKLRHPVVSLNWQDAVSYCQWLNEDTGRKFRLPTEAEWEYAARGAENLRYPWGNKWDPKKAVFNTSGTDSVDTHPEGASVFSGVRHMSGNVWEWAADWYANTYNPEDLKNPQGPNNGTPRVLRGGSWCRNSSDFLRSAYRGGNHPGNRYNNVGFRVSEDLK